MQDCLHIHRVKENIISAFKMLILFTLLVIINNIFLNNCECSVVTDNSANFTWMNKSDTHFSYTSNSASEQVDCLGLGKTVAKALEWFFANKANGSKALDVKFFLSSRNQPRRVKVLIGKQFGLQWTDFQIERKTVIIVHGFLSHSEETWIKEMEEAFLNWNDVNVVVIDWSAGGNTWNYYKAVVNTRIVGHQISRFLEHVVNTTRESHNSTFNLGTIHLVGHSLGAHICGFAAKEFKKKQTNWIISRITGLDPAQPCFRNADSSVQLHKSDAPFVDIIHTNSKMLSEIGLGVPEPIGHVDFYPNGGKSQPGCIHSNLLHFGFLPIPNAIIQQAICSHGRSYLYLTESLIIAAAANCTFWARHWDLTYRNVQQIMVQPCNSTTCIEMGINSENYPHRGTFFLPTAINQPFCINNAEIVKEAKKQLELDNIGELED